MTPLTAYARGLSRPDLDMATHVARVQAADHQLHQLQHPDPFRRVVSSNAPVHEVRMAVSTDPPLDDDDLEDADRAHRAEDVRGMQRRMNDVLR